MPRTSTSSSANVFHAQASSDEARIWHHLFKMFARVGNDVTLKVCSRKVTMTTLNLGHSAFVTATFPNLFFKDYSVTGKIDDCKILLKAMSAVFKFPANVEDFSIDLDCDKSELLIVLTCRDGITKRFRMLYEVGNHMQAVYDKVKCPNSAVLTKAKALLECLNNFHTGVEEVNMKFTKEEITWSSFQLGTPDFGGDRTMQTSTCFNPRQLHRYSFQGEPKAIFSIKELKEFVGFCDRIAVGVALSFSDPGMPIIFSAQRQDDDQNFELDLVLATIAADDEPHAGRAVAGEESLQPSQDPSSSHVASACGDDSVKRRQAGREAYAKGDRGGQKRVTAGKESAERGSMHGAGARQSGNTRKEPDFSGEGGRDSMDKFTHESIVSAATSDQQESVNSLGAGCSSLQSMNGGGGRRGESVAQRQRHSVIDDERVRGREGERNEGRSALVSQESESASAFESSAMASMSSMPSGPPPRRNAGKRPSAEEWISGEYPEGGGKKGSGELERRESSSSAQEKEGTDLQNSNVRVGSSHRPIQRAGTMRLSQAQLSDDPYSELDDDDEIVKATPSPPE